MQDMDTRVFASQGMVVEIASIVWMAIEAAVGVGTGVAAHSLALTTFGADSVVELVAGGVLLWRLQVEVSGRATAGRLEAAERRANAVVGAALLVLALYILVTAGLDIIFRVAALPSNWGLALAVASGIIMPLLASLKIRIGGRMCSHALQSDGACSKVCAYMAWTLIAGLLLNRLVDAWWLNGVVALPLLYFVITEGWEAVQESRRPT